MKTAYSYVRWSQVQQGESGRDSESRQTRSAREWVERYGGGKYVLSKEVFLDAGKSGWKGKHIATDEFGRAKGELRRFLQCVEEGKIKRGSILLIDSYDRFSRLEPIKALNLFLEVINSQIGLVFTGSYDKRVINAELINREPHILQFIIGEMIRTFAESSEKSRKIISAKQGKKRLMQSGQIVAHNNIPKYFTYVGTKVSGKYVHNDNTAIVKELIAGILAGKSLYALGEDLNKRKVKTFRYGFQWSGNSIRQILRNRTLIGEYLGVKNFVPPITGEETFNTIQNVLNGNKFNRGKVATYINIFKGICFCADPNCGKAMTVHYSKRKGREYRYFKCSVHGKHVECKNRYTFDAFDMEQEFFVNFLFKNPMELLNEGDSKEQKDLQTFITKKQTELNRASKAIEDTVALIGTVQMDELKTKLTSLNKRRDAINDELDSLTAQLSSIQDVPENFTNLQKVIGDLGKNVKRTKTADGGMEETDPAHDILDDEVRKVQTILKDNFTREGLNIRIRPLIGKIKVDTIEGRFYVYNRMGKLIYRSFQYESKRNATEHWRKSLKGANERRGGRKLRNRHARPA